MGELTSKRGTPEGHQGPKEGAPRDHCTWPRGTPHFGPQVELGEESGLISFLSTEN